MLAKLIKYDFKALSEKYCLMLIALALTGAIGSLLTFTKNEVLAGVLLFIAALFTVAVFTVFIVLALMYLYTTLSGSKSGFSYTLPVKVSHIVLSKLITVIIWAAITATVVILFWIVFFNALTANSSILNIFIAEIKTEILASFGESKIYSILLLFGTDIIFQFIGTVSIIVFCISLTCFPKFKNKNIGIAASVIGYFLIYYSFNILFAIILLILNWQAFSINAILSADETIAIFNQASIVVIAGWSIISITFYFLSSKMYLSHKNV